MTTYLCDFLPHVDGGHNHGSPKAAQDCREHWKAQREARSKRGYVNHSPMRQPTLEPKYH
jgi:hypothetical protein